jgi:hypothetical protein
MIQRIIDSKNFVAFILAGTTGMVLWFTVPFPEGNVFLQLMAVKAATVFTAIKYSYLVMLFTTPYIGFSILLSGLYIFTLKAKRRIVPARLPTYPDPRFRKDLCLVVGEVHNPRKPGPSEHPGWLTIPERGLFTGIAILGAVGTGKTSCCMYPFAEQLIAYKAESKADRIGGLVLEVKGDFCHKVKGILERHGRAEDYIEIKIGSEYRYNPLHNDLDAYALAYSIATLLNNLFGKGKEPFWQQAYTNLVKFIILLHKIAYDYVTLFDVYECAIDPELLEKRINESESKLMGKEFIFLSPETYADSVFVADHLRPAAKAAGVQIEDGQRFGLHNLRHSLSNWLVNKAKVEPKTVQGILRHSRIQTTLDLYTQEDSDEARGAQGKFLKAVGMHSGMVP